MEMYLEDCVVVVVVFFYLKNLSVNIMLTHIFLHITTSIPSMEDDDRRTVVTRL